MRARTLSILLSSLLPLAVAPGALAQTSGREASAPDEAGGAAAAAAAQVVVTANRSPMSADQVGQDVTVLTAEDLRQDQEISVADVLARTPGISLSRNGGPGETTSLFIRGAESAQTVVLIDGVKVNDPSDPGASFDFANLLTGGVSRIEVLEGPQSTLYGSQAIGGVVNVITATATRPLQAEAQIEGGSYGSAYAQGSVGGKADAYNWRLGSYYNTTDGVSAFDKSFGGRYPNGFSSAGLTTRLQYDLTSTLQVDERLYYTVSRNAFDGYDTPSFNFGDDSEFGRTQQLVDYTGLTLNLLDGRFKNRLAVEYSGIDRRDEDPNQPLTKYTFLSQGRAATVEYEGTFALTPLYQLVFGAQSERSSINAQAPYYDLLGYDAPTSAHVTDTSGYGQLTGQVAPGLTLTGGARYDDNSAFGDHLTGQASAAWRLNGGDTVLRASFGQGFKAPSLYELYSEYGNTTLRPESADGWDAGVEQKLLDGRLTVQATYFGRNTRNLIEFVDCYGVTVGACAAHQTFGGYYDNVARAMAEGVELQSAWTVTTRLTVTANYTFDASEDRSPGSSTQNLQLARRPKNTANLNAGYLWPIALHTDLAVRYAGDSYDDAAHTHLLKSYALVDLRASYPLSDALEAYGRLENLFNKRYETAYQYGTLGFGAYAGLRAHF